MSLVVISTHPIQYQAPVYRALQQQFKVPTTVIYGSDFSVSGYRDREFGTSFAWDTDLLSGYTSHFLAHAAEGGPQSYETVTTAGLTPLLKQLDFKAALILGYQPRFHFDAFRAVRQTGVPLLLRAEAADRNLQRNPLKRQLRDLVLRAFYRQFDRILPIGVEAQAHYRRLGVPDHRLIFAPYCVDTSPFDLTRAAEQRQSTRQSIGLSVEKIVILFSGKLVHRKAPDLLIAALKTLSAADRARFSLLFLGDGELHATLEQSACAQPSVDVEFVGFRNQRELSQYYHAADLLVLPSRSGETWGLVVNEALHHGLPCVVSDRVGCAPDLIQPGVTGEIFTADDPRSLADALLRALPLLGRAETATQCRAVVERYSVTAAARGLAQAYAEVTAP